MLKLIQKRYFSGYSGIRPGVKCRTLSSKIHDNPSKVVSSGEALSVVKSNDNVYIHGTPSTPTDLVKALCHHVEANNLTNIKTTHIILSGEIPFIQPKFYSKIRPNCLFIDNQLRPLVNQGYADYIPILLQDTIKLFDHKIIPIDVALVTVSPPDSHGYCSLGLNLETSSAACRNAKTIIGAINPNQPRTFGDSSIHISHFDYLVNSDAQIFEMSKTKPSKAEMMISKNIAENLIDNGSTLQTGIGSIPDTVLDLLKDHKNLGIHTEMVSTGVYELLEKGVITNSEKIIDHGKVVACFGLGTREFYNKMDNNTHFVLASSGYTNSYEIIAKQPKMTAINSAIEIDLTGQIVSDSIGDVFYSGFGGQVDFINGAGQAFDGKGKAIICLPSRTSKNESRIVPYLKQGAGVVTTRAHVRFVVTEYGIADLFGKNVRQRAYELINIAHPDDREYLEKSAFKKLKCIPSKD